MTLIAGVVLLALLLYGAHLWSRADPKALKGRLIRTGGYLALTAAVGMLVTGRIAVAIPLAGLGLAMLGRGGGTGFAGLFRNPLEGLFGGASAPRSSRVRSSWLDMELDHRSGTLSGTFTAGPYEGRGLDGIDIGELIALRARLDAQSLALLEAYLDRRAPAWRENGQADAGAGDIGGNRTGRGTMTTEEAYEILGLEPGAGEAEVRRAHRSLMKRLHPDHGGSDYLAARVNQAKDVILRRHG